MQRLRMIQALSTSYIAIVLHQRLQTDSRQGRLVKHRVRRKGTGSDIIYNKRLDIVMLYFNAIDDIVFLIL